jgi:hypothetical protein
MRADSVSGQGLVDMVNGCIFDAMDDIIARMQSFTWNALRLLANDP